MLPLFPLGLVLVSKIFLFDSLFDTLCHLVPFDRCCDFHLSSVFCLDFSFKSKFFSLITFIFSFFRAQQSCNLRFRKHCSYYSIWFFQSFGTTSSVHSILRISVVIFMFFAGTLVSFDCFPRVSSTLRFSLLLINIAVVFMFLRVL